MIRHTQPGAGFPKDFIWGAATASYQIEGSPDADGKGESIWDRFTHTPGRVIDGHTGDIACDSYRKMEEDIRIIRDIGLDAYRFSLAWPRIIPSGTGAVNQKGLDHYSRFVDMLLEAGIRPFVTMYHWDLPQALEDRGGWRVKDTSKAFGEYAAVVVKALGDRVKNWMTLNEPPCSAFAYYVGEHAPGCKESKKTLAQIIHNLLYAHGLGVQAVRAHGRPGTEVGLVHNPGVLVPLYEQPEEMAQVTKAFWYDGWEFENGWWLDPVFFGKYPDELWTAKGADVPVITPEEMRIISSPMDFIGLNVYSAGYLIADPSAPRGYRKVEPAKDHPKTAFGWGITPECIRFTLRAVYELYKPRKMYITENGAAFDDVISTDGRVHDTGRIEYLRAHIASARKALEEGIPLAGYFVWTLLDNFEWNFGYTKRLGLVFTVYDDKRTRILKDSAYWYRTLIRSAKSGA
jgi:beta-glucosidase